MSYRIKIQPSSTQVLVQY